MKVGEVDVSGGAGVEDCIGNGAAPACDGAVTVFFDGSCPLCQREIALARKLTGDDAVAYRDISGLDADDLVAPGLDVETAMARFHVRTADGAIKSGAAAFLEMWTQSPRLAVLRPLARSRVAVRMLDGVYAGFLKIRPRTSAAVRRYDAWRASRRLR